MQNFFDYRLLEFGENGSITVGSILLIVLYYVIFFIIFRWIKKFMRMSVKSGRLQQGQYFSITQISKYLLGTLFIIITLVTLKVDIMYFVALTPVLVGLGLGLQQVFNDLMCGLILLVEPSIRVNDIVEVDGIVARVKEIGLRTSKVEGRDGIIVIIPNHKLVSENLINWSSNNHITRFSVEVGVTYDSDVELVKKILVETAWKHERIKTNPAPFVRFTNFGESSLNFELLFWSNYLFPIKDVQSDLRFMIYDEFKKQGIKIPFPQHDVHIVSDINHKA